MPRKPRITEPAPFRIEAGKKDPGPWGNVVQEFRMLVELAGEPGCARLLRTRGVFTRNAKTYCLKHVALIFPHGKDLALLRTEIRKARARRRAILRKNPGAIRGRPPRKAKQAASPADVADRQTLRWDYDPASPPPDKPMMSGIIPSQPGERGGE